MRLSAFIFAEMPSILAEWDNFAQTMQPAADDMSLRQLRNHAELMLVGIAKDIETEQSVAEQIIKSHGGKAKDAQTTAGEEHGIARLESRFTLEQLASEFRALRASVLMLWKGKSVFKTSDVEDIIRFNEAIDQLLSASIASFSQTTKKSFDDELKRREQFLAMLAHELRNPLAPISASAMLLKTTPDDIRTINKASNIIARQVAHLTSLVDDLLEVSRINSGSAVLKMENFDFRRAIDSALEQVHPRMVAKNHRLDTPHLEHPIFMSGDSKRLVQVLVNLLVNASKYTPDNGHIFLTVEVRGDCVELAIEDNGIGIAPEFLPHVFELFSQANPSLHRTSGGLGLGLPLVKSLIEQHSGKVKCASAGLGKGSRFSVTLPIYVDDAMDVEHHKSASIPAVTQHPIKVMVVDDNIDAAEILGMLLKSLGYQVVIVHDATEALSKSQTELPDVFLLDIGLPTMDGNELARRIRLLPAFANCVIVAVTGYSQADTREEALRSGFNHFMTKPVDISQLQSVLDSVRALPR